MTYSLRGRRRSWSGPVQVKTDFQGRLRFSEDSRPVNSACECVDSDLVFCGSGRKGNLYNVGAASISRGDWVPRDMARAYGSESIGFEAAVEQKPSICGVRSFIAFQSIFVQQRTCVCTHSLTQTKKSILESSGRTASPSQTQPFHIFGPDPRFSFLDPVVGRCTRMESKDVKQEEEMAEVFQSIDLERHPRLFWTACA